MLDAQERDGAKVPDVVISDKAIGAVCRLECDAQAVFGHNGVKVASNWVLYLADARVRGSFSPEEDLPNSVPHSTHQMIARSIQTTAWTRVSFRQQLPGNVAVVIWKQSRAAGDCRRRGLAFR